MVGLLVKYVVRESEADAFADAVTCMASLVKEHEPGCLVWQVWRSVDERNVFHFHEVYRDEAALEEHRATTHFQKIVGGELRPRAASRQAATCELVAST
jgi:(4S)-4-hydroxy-5-phosphonooxypentane-2,3-dione isomerase